jgi:peptidoglycan hydrolase CwlO-like protein
VLEEEKRSAEGLKREKEKSLSHAISRKKEVEKRLEKLLEVIANFKSMIDENTRKVEDNNVEINVSAKECEGKIES